MPSSPHRKPTAAAQRAAIATALGVPLWRVFWHARHLTGLTAMPPADAAASIVLSLLDHHFGNGAADRVRRVQAIANWRIVSAPITNGQLTDPFRFLDMHDRVTLLHALSGLIEYAHDWAMYGGFANPETNSIPNDAIEFCLHGRSASLHLRFASGLEWRGVFSSPDLPPVPPELMVKRLWLSAGAIIELSRLCFGDPDAEHRIGVFTETQTPVLLDPCGVPPMPHPAAQSYVPLPTRGRRRRRHPDVA